MSKQRTSKTEYKVYYGVDSHASVCPSKRKKNSA